jgi:beta-glucoside operon transcriptional antiterminator
MRIVKVFNNNVALVKDEGGHELVVQGRGIAYQAKAGDWLAPARIERRFYPEPTATPEQLGQTIADIPIELIYAAEEILRLGPQFGLELDPRAAVALADHISIAVRRVAAGRVLDNPLEWEVRTLYAHEVRLGFQALDVIHRRTGIRLPQSEAVPLALHFVNAQAGAQVLSEAVRTVRLIRDILAIIGEEFGQAFADRPPISEARFATHLRYLFLSHLSGGRHTPLIAELAKSYPDQEPRAFSCAQRIANYLQQKMAWQIGDDETVYLALHIQRMTYPGE